MSRGGPRSCSAFARLVAPALLALVVAVLPACSHASTAPPLPPSTVLTITGHGFGHGHGLSQYGARGAATRGVGYRQILSFFYPHTKVADVGGRVAVLITKDTTRDVVVQARSRLMAQQVGSTRTWDLTRLHPRATRWRIVPAAGGRNELDYRATTWRRQSVVSGTLQFYAAGQPITLYLPHGTAAYRGILRSVTPKAGSSDRDTVNVVGLEAYLKGVVPTEMPASWPQAALRAQAVAARTYAVYERTANAGRPYQICDTSACQNYGGDSARASGSDAAVTATAGKILTYGGQPAFTQFAASDGGWTRSGGQPYLDAKQDVYEQYAQDPNRTWTAKVTVKQLEARWPSLGPITGVSLTRDATRRWVDHVSLAGRDGAVDVAGDDFSRWAGLRSAWFTIKVG